MEHVLGPVGGVLGPSADPLEADDSVLFGGTHPRRFMVAPLSRRQLQEDRNSCNPHAHAYPIENKVLARGPVFQVCRADVYSGGLFLDGNEGRDVGTTMAAMGRWINEKGVLSEFERPYKSDDVTRRSKPELDARRMRGPRVSRIAVDVDALKSAIVPACGVPYGQPVRANYAPDADGRLPIPAGVLRGYHATTLVGWDDDLDAFLMVNWWDKWGIEHPDAQTNAVLAHLRGQRGFAWVPYAWCAAAGAMFEPAFIQGDLPDVEAA